MTWSRHPRPDSERSERPFLLLVLLDLPLVRLDLLLLRDFFHRESGWLSRLEEPRAEKNLSLGILIRSVVSQTIFQATRRPL